MDARSVQDWKLVLSNQPSPEGTPVEHVAANRVLGDLVGYRHGSRDRKRDVQELANAMQAWVEMNREVLEPKPTRRHASDEYAEGEANGYV